MNKIIDPFNNIDSASPPKIASDLLLTQKYSEGNIQNPNLYSSSKPFYKVIVGVKRGKGVDFTDLQKAIDKVNILGGGTIFINAGIYVVNQNITLYSNITLLGEDNNTTIIDFNLGQYGIYAPGIDIGRLNNIHIKNIQVINSRLTSAAFTIHGAISFFYVDNCSITDCYFSNNVGSIATEDIHINYCTRFQIERNYSISSQFIFVYSSVHGNIVDNYISGYSVNTGTSCKHIYISASSKIKAMRNTIIGSSEHGIYHNNTSTNCRYESNHIEDCATRGIYIESGESNFIVNNYIVKTTTGTYGIGFNVADYSVVQGNIVIGVTSNAITIAGTNGRCTVSGNIVKGVGGKGIYIVSDYVVISGNAVTGCVTGLYIDSGSNKCVAVANHLLGNTTALTDASPDSTVQHNVIV